MDEDQGSSIAKSRIPVSPKLNDTLHFLAGSPLWTWRDSIHNTLQEIAKNKSDSPETESSNSTPTVDEARSAIESSVQSGCFVMPPFSPYSAKVPWHTGTRALLSQIFPKYGNYCGPNWSSGRHNGSLVWDVAPVDWLDFCCYKHDVGYDSHSQEELYKADLELLECLRKMPRERLSPRNRIGYVREFYRNVCILGLERVLIPYRRRILKQQ